MFFSERRGLMFLSTGRKWEDNMGEITPIPDLKIHNLILHELQCIPDVQLNLEECRPEVDDVIGSQSWRYAFRFEGSPTYLKFRFAEVGPGLYLCTSSVLRSQQVYFTFDDYLTYIHNSDLENFLRPSDPYKYVEKYLRILIKHIQEGLKDVLIGKTWIDVPFDWKKVGR